MKNQPKTLLPLAQVLVFKKELTHSVWVDLIHRCRTRKSLERYLMNGTKTGRFVDWRLVYVQSDCRQAGAKVQVCMNPPTDEERILQITNDVSEDMCCADRRELMQVVKYWADAAAKSAGDLVALRTKLVVGLTVLLTELREKQ